LFELAAVRRWLKFGVVGGANTAVDYGVFAALTWCGLPYLAAQCLSYACGVLNSYVWNRSWTFRDRAASTRSLPRFAAVNAATFALTSALLYAFVGRLGWPLLAGKAAATGAGLIFNYAGTSKWAFRDPGNSTRRSDTP
jgi:putative flippase GtrA